MKAVCCDVCWKRNAILTTSPKYFKWKSPEGVSFRIDVCDAHGKEIQPLLKTHLRTTESAIVFMESGYRVPV